VLWRWFVIVEEEYITTEELCKWLKISKTTANTWRRRGLPFVRVGNAVRYEKIKVKKWLEESKIN